VRRRDW